jgi:hypothetical protein
MRSTTAWAWAWVGLVAAGVLLAGVARADSAEPRDGVFIHVFSFTKGSILTLDY